jgi:hypothetical protein
MPDHGGELGSDLLSVKHSVYAGREEWPQPAPPGCGLIHFIAATVTTRGPNLLGGMFNHYNFVIFGKPKVLIGELTFALPDLRS